VRLWLGDLVALRVTDALRVELPLEEPDRDDVLLGVRLTLPVRLPVMVCELVVVWVRVLDPERDRVCDPVDECVGVADDEPVAAPEELWLWLGDSEGDTLADSDCEGDWDALDALDAVPEPLTEPVRV
jgi:hypothetical protein